jgi:hypothetical protein
VKSAGDIAAVARLPTPRITMKVSHTPAVINIPVRLNFLFMTSLLSGAISSGQDVEKYRPYAFTPFEYQDANPRIWIPWQVGKILCEYMVQVRC